MKFIILAVAIASGVFSPNPFVVAATPLNDDCGLAKIVSHSQLPFLETVDFSLVSVNPDGPVTSCSSSVSKSLWYEYTPPSDGILTVITSDFKDRLSLKPGVDIVLGAFSGSCSNLTEIECLDFGGTGKEFVYPVLTANVTYLIQVGDLGDVGSGILNVSLAYTPYEIAVSGDECIDAKDIPHASLPYSEQVDVRLYTNNVNDIVNSCNFDNEGNTFWYKYTPPSDGLMIVDTPTVEIPIKFPDYFFSENLLSVMGAFTGTCGNLTQVMCVNRQFIDTLYYPVKKGVTYTIKVGEFIVTGYGLGIVNFTLSFERNYFSVFDAGKQIAVLNDVYNGIFPSYINPNSIDYGSVEKTALSIAAEFTTPTSVRSVRLRLDNKGPSICENKKPYRMLGEGGKADTPFAIGNRIITATGYSNQNCKGNVVGTISQEFSVRGCDNLNYELYDAERNIYLRNVYNSSKISRAPCKANIGVAFQCGFVPDKVRLELRKASNNALVAARDELQAPYFLFGDNGSGDIGSGRIPAGEYTVTAIINNIVHPSVRFTMNKCIPNSVADNTFDIDIRFANENYGTLYTYEYAKLFTPIIERVSSLIIGDKPDFLNTTSFFGGTTFCGGYPARIDDLFICIALVELNRGGDSILSQIQYKYVRESDNLPVAATIFFDINEFEKLSSTGLADDYILSQLIQTLGLGDSWDDFGLVNSVAPCSYRGNKAKAEFMAITGCSSDIPLEENAVPSVDGYDLYDCLFWDPTCLKNEVLTFTLGQKKISRISLAALEDLGYNVNYTAADPYDISDIGTCRGCNRRNLKGDAASVESVKPKTSMCGSGLPHDRAIHQGRNMMREMHDLHLKQTENSPNQPDGAVYVGHNRISVTYRHEDGKLCTVVVSGEDVFEK